MVKLQNQKLSITELKSQKKMAFSVCESSGKSISSSFSVKILTSSARACNSLTKTLNDSGIPGSAIGAFHWRVCGDFLTKCGFVRKLINLVFLNDASCNFNATFIADNATVTYSLILTTMTFLMLAWVQK